MPPRTLRNTSIEERFASTNKQMSDGTISGRSRSAYPVRRRSGLQGPHGTGDHDHMGTGLDSTIIQGLRDTDVALASGDGSFAGGDDAQALALTSIAIGPSARALEGVAGDYGQIAIGQNARAQGLRTTAVGWNAVSTADYGAAFGAQAQAAGAGSTAIGPSAYVTALAGSGTALGGNGLVASHTGSADYSIGIMGTTYGSQNVAVGYASYTDDTVAVANVFGSTALGSLARCEKSYSVALGYNAVASAAHLIVLGTAAETVVIPGALSVSGGTTIPDDSITYAKMQNVSAASRLLGRGSASGAGDPEEITLGTNLSMSGTTLNATGGGGSAGTPALTFSTTNATGAASTFIATDATIALFDATTPTALTVAGAGSVGTAGTAPRRDHTHPMPGAFVASGASHASGFVPDPGASAGTTKFLREDATWAVPPGTGGGSSPLTTKGDVWGYSTVDARIPVGSNGQVLTADSTQTLGLKWAAAGSGSVATDTIWDAKGDLAVGTGADTAAKLTVGSNGQMIVADSTQSTGLKWQGDTSWTAPTLVNSWANYGSGFEVAGYWKDADGWVHLRGLVKTGAAATTIFTLASGYRPANAELFSTIGSTGGGGATSVSRVDVNADGTVVCHDSRSDFLSLSGIKFRP